MSLPKTALAKRIAALFGRKLTTHWDPKEIARFLALIKNGSFDDPDELDLIEKYYAFERKKGANGVHRRALYTFLNNLQGELDKAREWREQHPLKPVIKKIIQMPPVPGAPFVPPSDPEEIARLERFQEERQERKRQRGFLL